MSEDHNLASHFIFWLPGLKHSTCLVALSDVKLMQIIFYYWIIGGSWRDIHYGTA